MGLFPYLDGNQQAAGLGFQVYDSGLVLSNGKDQGRRGIFPLGIRVDHQFPLLGLHLDQVICRGVCQGGGRGVAQVAGEANYGSILIFLLL